MTALRGLATLPLRVAAGTWLVACGGAAEPVCAASGGTVGVGDANGDGHVDIADPLYVQAHLFLGGPAPACVAAADLLADGQIENGDASPVLSWLFSGGTTELPASDVSGCAPAAPTDTCGRLELRIDAPKRSDAAEFQAVVSLVNADLEPGPRGWSLGVEADGCAIVGATVDGTVGAPEELGASPGMRRSGYAHAEVVDGAAVSAVVLSATRDVHLAPSEDPRALLRLTVRGQGGCGPCTLSLTDGLRGDGQPVEVVFENAGARYQPPLASSTTEVCPG